MGTIHENILNLCNKEGIKPGKMCADLGMSRSLMTDLKSGRKKSINAATAQKIADYFGVSMERVIGGETEKAPTDHDGRLTDDDIKFALFGGDGEITDAMYEEVKQFAQMVKMREDQKKKG